MASDISDSLGVGPKGVAQVGRRKWRWQVDNGGIVGWQEGVNSRRRRAEYERSVCSQLSGDSPPVPGTEGMKWCSYETQCLCRRRCSGLGAHEILGWGRVKGRVGNPQFTHTSERQPGMPEEQRGTCISPMQSPSCVSTFFAFSNSGLMFLASSQARRRRQQQHHRVYRA